MTSPRRPFGLLALCACLLTGGCASRPTAGPAPAPTSAPAVPASQVVEATPQQVTRFCGACHAVPPPDCFPKQMWRDQIHTAYGFTADPGVKRPPSAANLQPPPFESVVRYYERRAPARIPFLKAEDAPGPPPVSFTQAGFREPGVRFPSTSNVSLVHLYSKTKLDILSCDMKTGNLMVTSLYKPGAVPHIIARLENPAHAEVADIDGDGIPDILVADLGVFIPGETDRGRVVLLKGKKDGTFIPFTLLSGVGRVADVQMADFNRDGLQDLVVAEFGYHHTGSIIVLQNRTTDWRHPKFQPHVMDDRTGAIHVPVCDLNGDGRPDFVALLAQEHEAVVAFLNKGDGRFEEKTIYAAPHPAYGSSGIQMVDFNGDGKLGVLYTNGDVFDPHSLLRPDQQVQWLENRGTFPFVHHTLTQFYGALRAVAADVEANGRMDIVAGSFLPSDICPQRKALGLDSLVLLSRTPSGAFKRYSLEKVHCDHSSCAAGDIYGDGRVDIVAGNFGTSPAEGVTDAFTVWRNRGPAANTPAPARRSAGRSRRAGRPSRRPA